MPISQGEKLWGLLVAYQNSQPRYWQEEEINLLAQDVIFCFNLVAMKILE